MLNGSGVDKRMILYLLEDVKKDLEYYITKIELHQQRIEKEMKLGD